MRNKFFNLAVILLLLFSLQGFSQTTEKSKHPLLDKYYPQLQNNDTNKAVTTQIKPAPETKTTPVVTSATVPALTTSPAMNTTTSINKPTTVTVQPPPVQKVPAQPGSLYRETRLGSSTPQYDTWEKNNNGAGSVTTSPK